MSNHFEAVELINLHDPEKDTPVARRSHYKFHNG